MNVACMFERYESVGSNNLLVKIQRGRAKNFTIKVSQSCNDNKLKGNRQTVQSENAPHYSFNFDTYYGMRQQDQHPCIDPSFSSNVRRAESTAGREH